MPTERVVGAYVLTAGGDASLVNEPGVLSTASLVALGFGDLAQLEYRHSAALSARSGQSFGLPTIGIQVALPIPERRWVPRFGVALRLGLDREEELLGGGGDGTVIERASDLYFVAGEDLGPATVHAGVRVAAAALEPVGGVGETTKRTLLLPALGVSGRATAQTVLLAEVALVPRFAPGTDAPIASALFARAGTRWALWSWLSIDASVGYRIEVRRRETTDDGNALIDWDIRLGGELSVPWGRLACRGIHLFCP